MDALPVAPVMDSAIAHLGPARCRCLPIATVKHNGGSADVVNVETVDQIPRSGEFGFSTQSLFSPALGTATGLFNGLHPKSKFLATGTAEQQPGNFSLHFRR